MRASLIRVLVIVVTAVAAGLIRAKDLPWVPDLKALQAKEQRHKTLRETIGISLERMLELVEQGAVVIDARPRQAYEEGHLLLHTEPPVLNVPADAVDEHAVRLTDLVGLPVVLYCTSETCDYAEELYAALQGFGFTDIWIYFPGWEGIVEAGLETTTGPDTWTGFYGQVSDADEDYADEGEGEANTPAERQP
jgi:rhodanese-related sulfurtransferase